MTAPAVGIVLDVLIRESVFEGATVQIKRHHIGRRERPLGQVGHEEFVDDPFALDAHPALRRPRGMRRHHEPTAGARWTERHRRAIVERAAVGTFWAAERSCSGKREAQLDLRAIQQRIVFAAQHVGQPGQVDQHRSGPILPIQAQDGAFRRELGGLHIALYRFHGPAQFRPVLAVAGVAKGAEPLVGMGLQDGVRVRTTSPRLRPT
jgi:hypothetical protein